MAFEKMIERFESKTPFAVMFRAVLENTFSTKQLDELFVKHAQRQFQKQILFSMMVDLVGRVASKSSDSLHAAYQSVAAELDFAVEALYRKLQGIELPVSQALVRESALHLRGVIQQTKVTQASVLPGFTVKIVDGNHLAATERRLAVTRQKNVAPLPGQALVILDPQVGLVQDVILCEDAHQQERALWPQLVECVQEGEVWIANRNFCTANILFGIKDRQAYFLVRRHSLSPAQELLGERVRVAENEEGVYYEQVLRITHEDGRAKQIRCVTLELREPTKRNETVIEVLTNLPKGRADVVQVLRAYRQRWSIEQAFLTLAQNTKAEIETLGYPRAALFSFSVALVVFNIYATLAAAVRATHPTPSEPPESSNKKPQKKLELSIYYVSQEILHSYEGMLIALDEQYWQRKYANLTPQQLALELLRIAGPIKLEKYRKHPRAPNKKQTTVSKKQRQHAATSRLLK